MKNKSKDFLEELTFPLLLKRYREQLLFGRFGELHLKEEILRRYEALEKQAINWAKIAGAHQKQIVKLVDEIENLKCCGNCKWSISRDCKYWQRYRDCGSYPALDSYCDKWQYDGLTREEREGK